MAAIQLIDAVETDVLVIGGGGAGARAAIETAYSGAKVMLCAKNAVGRSGATAYRIVELAGFNVVNESSEGGEDDYHRDMVKAALGMCDPNVSRVVASEADNQRVYLEGLGMEFKHLGDEYLSFTGCFATKRRTLILEGHGHAIMQVMQQELQRLDIPLYEDLMIVDLLVDDGRITGALGVYESGEWLVIRAGAVVLGAGGAAGMFRLNMNPSEITGDGYALAYRAGAVMTNMEFMQFGLATIHPNYNLIGNWLFPLRPMVCDADGKELITQYLPEGITLEDVYRDKEKHFPFTSRDHSRYIEIAVHTEVSAGRTGANGGVYLDFRDVAQREDTLSPHDREVWEMAKSWLLSRDIDITATPAEVAVFAHAVNGGALIDETGVTSLAGLFAAGENAAGPHGADRLGGNMLVTSQVFGAKAGRGSAAYAKDAGASTHARLMELARGIIATLPALNGGGGNNLQKLAQARTEVMDVLCRKMMVVRSEEGYRSCLQILDRTRELMACIGACDSPDMLRMFLELRNMTETAGLMLEAGSRRKESRGGHYRTDFPQSNDQEYGKNYFLQNQQGTHRGWFQDMADYRRQS